MIEKTVWGIQGNSMIREGFNSLKKKKDTKSLDK